MPRGGKRPRAGAPRGNLNALRRGNFSPRLVRVYFAILLHPDPRALARDLATAGFFPTPARRFNGDLRGAVRYLHGQWFDCSREGQSNAIKANQPQSTHPLSPPVLEAFVESAVGWMRAGVAPETAIARVIEVINQTQAAAAAPPPAEDAAGTEEDHSG